MLVMSDKERIAYLEKELKELTELYEDEEYFIDERAWEIAEKILKRLEKG
jgi:hypothetical protein